MIIELRKKGPKGRRIYVSCVNKDKGGVARKACANACIGCSKCFKVCQFEAITIENNLAYIDHQKCRLCRKCAAECRRELSMRSTSRHAKNLQQSQRQPTSLLPPWQQPLPLQLLLLPPQQHLYLRKIKRSYGKDI